MDYFGSKFPKIAKRWGLWIRDVATGGQFPPKKLFCLPK